MAHFEPIGDNMGEVPMKPNWDHEATVPELAANMARIAASERGEDSETQTSPG